MQRRQLLGAAALAGLGSALPLHALAQSTYPSRTVRLVVPFPPGGPTDIMGRTAAQAMSAQLGQTFIVENKAGAGGNIGTDTVAKASPDGYTIGLAAISSLAITPHLYSNVPFNVATDFAPISLAGTTPCAIMVHPDAPFQDLAGLIAYAKANPGKIDYATSGIGTSNHLATELLQSVAGIELNHVPYKGSSQIVPDLLSGTLMMSMESSLVTTLQYVKSGKLRAIAVTSPQRSPALPDVPTVAESGFEGFAVETWFGLIAPAGTPVDVVNRLQKAWADGAQTDEARQAFANISANLRVQSPQEFADFIRSENERWGKLIHQLGIKVE